MGTAEVVPGVSGGTVALAVRVYEPLVTSLSALASAAVALLRRDVQRASGCVRRARWRVVLPVFAGVVIAVLAAARVIPPLLEEHPEQVRGLFFGLILASLVIPWRMMEEHTTAHLGLIAAAAALSFVLTGLSAEQVPDPPLPLVAAAAAVAVIALVLPGVSGSFLLLAMGLYEATLAALNSGDLPYIVTFSAGAIVGLGVFARLLDWLLENRRDVTLAVVVGLIAGALRAVWPYTGPGGGLQPPPLEASALEVLGLVIAGIALVAAVFIASTRAEQAGM